MTYRGKCAMASPEADRYVVHLETTCGEAKHYCALFKQRDANVMEFQLGESSQTTHPFYGSAFWAREILAL